uniref:Uncharacterized protein n=1 Tax=Capra hircus TaxID=9925 RepID=A0A8C2NE51_CAPHI
HILIFFSLQRRQKSEWPWKPFKVPDPLRRVLDSRHAVQQSVPASLASGFPCFCLCGCHGCTSLLGPLPHLFSSAFQPAQWLLPPLHSHGTEVSQKMVLTLREHIIF